MTTPAPASRLVIAFRRDRIIARIRNFLSAWDFARRVNGHVLWNWDNRDVADNAPCAFFDLFSEEGMAALADEVSLSFMTGDAFDEQPYAKKSDAINKTTAIDLDALRGQDFGPIWYAITQTAGGTVPRVDEKRALFQRLPIHPKIERALAEQDRRFDLKNAVSVHIRRGDMIWANYGIQKVGRVPGHPITKSLARVFAYRYAPTPTYYRAISGLPEDQSLVLFSDDTEVREAFFERYKDRVLDVHAMLDQSDFSRAQRDFVEFLLMTRTKQVLSSESAFSAYAAELGGSSLIYALAALNA
ncbi:MAG: hypothetical protein AAGP08_13115, partial [Pseudomonadota bacterium]